MGLTLIQADARTGEVSDNISNIRVLFVRDSLPCHRRLVNLALKFLGQLSQLPEEFQITFFVDDSNFSRSSDNISPHLLLVVLICYL